MISPANSFDEKIAASKLKLHAEQNAITFLASNIGVPITVAALLINVGNVESPLVLTWLATGFVICLIRALHHRSLRSFETSRRSLKAWENDLVILSGCSGLFWSACGILFLNTENPTQSLIVISAILGVLSGAVPALASQYRVFMAFILATWCPAGLYFLTLSDPLYLGVSLLGTLFLIIVISFSRSQRRAVEQALRLRYENIELLEELRIQKQKAEDASRAKSRFLAVASHDLRQPIHAMRLFSDSLSSRIQEESSMSIMRMLRSSIETLSGLFDSLLDISKLDAEAIDPSIHHVDVTALLRNLHVEISAQCLEKDLYCSLRCSKRFFVETDPVLLERILRNLIWNAVKFTADGGILIAARQRGEILRIEVWDTGCGIPEDEQPKIFSEFHQVDRPEQDAREGIGLGLSIVSRLCTLLGFNISLRSKAGRGSVFFLEMPLVEARRIEFGSGRTTQTLHEIEDTDLTGVQVLVVEDEEGIRNAMRLLLEDWGCKPIIVESDKQVLEALEQFVPDILLTDFHLRNSVSGDKVIELVNEEVGYSIPSIIITGDTSPEQLTLAKARCDQLMHKPIDPDQLKSNLIRLLNEQTFE